MGKQMAETYGLDERHRGHQRGLRIGWNIAFEQAENRMHTIKAMLVATLGD